MPPAHTFVKLCTSAKIAVPPKAQHIAFLTNAGIQNTNAPAKDIHERCAALAWARASIAAATDPDSWATMLDASLHPTLLGAPASPSPAQARPPPTPPTLKKRPRMLMHIDLAAQLPPEVYLALDAAAGMDPEKRAKFHKACQDSAVTALLDNTTSAAFGHQTLLTLTEGQHFDPFKRGRALAGAGRSAPTGPSQFNEQVARDES
jgi:hypothetical protein